ncbi:MAG TPA: hypothetical protein VFC68_07905 [Treponemataceae bacterium]|nr:hypothetical protein [Treponemataceae bacterium]
MKDKTVIFRIAEEELKTFSKICKENNSCTSVQLREYVTACNKQHGFCNTNDKPTIAGLLQYLDMPYDLLITHKDESFVKYALMRIHQQNPQELEKVNNIYNTEEL